VSVIPLGDAREGQAVCLLHHYALMFSYIVILYIDWAGVDLTWIALI